MGINRYLNALENHWYKYFYERKGFRTKRKIVVIESDDWGSIRMPSKKIYNECLKNGYRVDNNLYERYDALESEDDLEYLFELLKKYKDYNGNFACFTANTLVANPDFTKIKNNNYQKYFYETIDQTFSTYPQHKNSLNLWYQGGEEGVFKIQYHGREHLNVSHFMTQLKLGSESAHWALNHKMLGCIEKQSIKEKIKNHYVAATQYDSLKDKIEKEYILIEGLKIFKKLHKIKPRSFIAPNYRWHPDFNSSLFNEGIEFLQGNYIQRVPYHSENYKEKKIFHYLGEKNEAGQFYLVRNCQFEPTLFPKMDSINNCLSNINKAFLLNKPAIIGSHRVNYIGYIDESNRDKNLKLLDLLLKKITEKWPDVEFFSSDQLGALIKKSN